MNLLNSKKYQEQIDYFSKSMIIDWKTLRGKTILISGATGMIGKCLIDLIMNKNKTENLNCTIIALGRNQLKIEERFSIYFESEQFIFEENDINNDINLNTKLKVDYIIHAASSTHPIQYSTEPVNTITTNVIGTNNLLKLAVKNKSKFLFCSSVEIYGENKRDVEMFSEDYLGYINCNTLRAGYPESKRTGEALCQAYKKQEKIKIVIARLARIFGPTMLLDDSKASSQFIKNAMYDEDIILKSEGLQNYSYLYVFDAVIGILKLLINGENGEAYNVSDENFNITLKDFAKVCADTSRKKIIFNLPSEVEKTGYSIATKALMDSKKINELGWKAEGNIEKRIKDTIEILKEIKGVL